MAQPSGYGWEVVHKAYEALQIDAGWTDWREHGFDWWCSDLRQSIWADSPREDNGYLIQRVCATTAMLRDVPDTPKMRAGLSILNANASLSAFIYLEEQRRIILWCSVIAHEENVGWVKRLFAAATAHQVADAGIKAEMGRLLGGVRDSSHHPINGPRPMLDEISMVIEQVFVPAGQGESPFVTDIGEVLAMQPRPWLMADRTKAGMSALLRSWSADGSVANAAPNGEPTMLHVSVADRHPQLGAGALVRVTLPIPGNHASNLADANLLNLSEGHNDATVFTLGGWCAIPSAPFCHALFLPAYVHAPGLLQTIMFMEAMRATWAASLVRW